MKASDVLLCLEGKRLEVGKNIEGKVHVAYEDCWVKGVLLEGIYGIGEDFESACEDYLKKIRGRTLVFRPGTKERREVVVLG